MGEGFIKGMSFAETAVKAAKQLHSSKLNMQFEKNTYL